MTVNPAIAPYVPTYAAFTPYITPDEYVNDPNGMNVEDLVPGGDYALNLSVLEDLIRRASAWCDSIARQRLCATVDTQVGEYVLRNGWVSIPFDFSPIIAITAVQWGFRQSQLMSVADLSDAQWTSSKVVKLPLVTATSGPMPTSMGTGVRAGRVIVNASYVNGFANTVLTDAAAAGDTDIVVDNAAGIIPGAVMTIYDRQATEVVTVDGSYVFGSTSVPLAAGLVCSHESGAAFSALPADIRQAAISLTTSLIKIRSNDALVMASMTDQPTKAELEEAGGLTDKVLAETLLAPFARVR